MFRLHLCLYYQLDAMLRDFNTSYVSVTHWRLGGLIHAFNISIHHMFRLHLPTLLKVCNSATFQYIICFGYTATFLTAQSRAMRFQYIICFGYTFLWRIFSHPRSLFQYIICFGYTWGFGTVGHCRTIFQYIICFGYTFVFFCMHIYSI